MSILPTSRGVKGIEYPTSDGKPMAETDWHRDLMVNLILTLKMFFAPRPRVYVSGNLLLFYERGNKHRHVSPDVFVVKGVAKHERPHYLLWEERKGPNVVFELTSKTTRKEDLEGKFELYRDVLRVKEYFLFDPLGDYLEPPLRGFRLQKGIYVPLGAVDGRFPSKELGLHLEPNGKELRLYDPDQGKWLPTPQEAEAQAREMARREAEMRQQEEMARKRAEAEVTRLQRELEDLRRKAAKGK
jgi:Uma2 family endonuclease